MTKFEGQQRREAVKQAQEEQGEKLLALQDFEQSVSGVPEAKRRRVESDLLHTSKMAVDKHKARDASFWVQEETPQAPAKPVEKPDGVTKCPMTGSKLRMKDLIPVVFELSDEKLADTGGTKGMWCCAVSKRPITHQKAVLLKPSGQVIMESALKDCVLPEMRCPISGKKLKSSDIIKLQTGGTSFCAHNEVEAKKDGYIPARATEGGARVLNLNARGGFG
mmetsp:Transcript_13870/g.30697  ORF Transcript_13870/g.30697 Transcript_13870/m.30697 type:complete len:221 (+) Transcript_13870:2-664(+)